MVAPTAQTIGGSRRGVALDSSPGGDVIITYHTGELSAGVVREAILSDKKSAYCFPEKRPRFSLIIGEVQCIAGKPLAPEEAVYRCCIG